MIVHVGQPTLHGSLEGYARHFDLLELRAEVGRLPRLTQLKRWRKAVPQSFVFSVVVPIDARGLDAARRPDAGTSYAVEVAQALRAQWLVLSTSADVMPGRASRERLSSIVASLRGVGPALAWEPHGPWSSEQAERFAADVGAVLVIDAAESEPAGGPTVYTRLRALAHGGRLRSSAIERAAERLAGCTEAFVVLEGRGGARGAALLRDLLAAAQDEANPAEPASGAFAVDDDEPGNDDEDEPEDDEDPAGEEKGDP
jgi:hypothetical protein